MCMFISMEKYQGLKKLSKINVPLIAQSLNRTTEQQHPGQSWCISSGNRQNWNTGTSLQCSIPLGT